MRVFLIGAGQVGSTIVEALHEDHEITVLDTEASRLQALTDALRRRRVRGRRDEPEGSRRRRHPGRRSRHRLHLARRGEPRRRHVRPARGAERATTVIRTSSIEYVELWREGQLDVDFVVSSELETAYAISRILGVPAARQTDVFADGQVQVGEFEVDGAASPAVVGVPLRDAEIPEDSKVAAIIRTDETVLPGGDDEIRNGDRIVVIGSPQAVKAWSTLLWPEGGTVRDVVIYGAGRVGSAIARVLLSQGISVRMIEASREQARRAAEALPKARVFNATGFDTDFLERERIGQSQAGIFAMRDDAKNQYAATLAQVQGIPFTVAIAHEAASVGAFDKAGIDVSINPRAVTAEEIVRFAHDPRTQQVAMIEGNRYEVLDVTTRESSRYIGMAFRDMPVHGSIIGAIVRNGARDLPARRRRPAGGRPRDHLHRGRERALGRRGAVS